MKKPYVVPNIITAMGLSIGLFVLFKAALSEGHGEARALLFKSALLILAAACVDVLDGFAARRLKGESLFGMRSRLA
jgi:CDP-diacylglycerol--serine O-phosphatidyltransferase